MKILLSLVKFIFTLCCISIILLTIFLVFSAEKLGDIRERISDFRESRGGAQYSGLDTKTYILVAEKNRIYLLHVPKNYNPRVGAPLLLGLHGGMGNAQNMKIAYDLVQKSDKEGFILVLPNGASRFENGNFATWNAGTCCGYAQESESDDVEFMRALIKDIKDRYKVDKVFAIGMSNGGLMAYRLACDAPEMLDGIGSVAGTDNTITCTPSESTPLIHIHALDDDHVLYEGGCGSACISEEEPQFISVPETIEKWKDINLCASSSVRTLTSSGATCDLYDDCTSGSAVKLCVTQTGGHSWPGTAGNPITIRDKAPPSQAINATDMIWDFFETIQ